MCPQGAEKCIGLQEKLKEGKQEMGTLQRCIQAANDKVIHREKALSSALAQLRTSRTCTGPSVSTTISTSTQATESSRSGCVLNEGVIVDVGAKPKANQNPGKKAKKDRGVSNATTSRAGAAKAADAAAEEQAKLERQLEEQARTITVLQAKVEDARNSIVAKAGVLRILRLPLD
ncbi:MAG: hypothetical protein HC767_03265 [Akkermansiaceae bacterium]|nr:hypothetical protein [Akkermansiaceae bacterium]